MTREEAIEELKELLRWYLEEEPMSETVYKREAVSMAISALSENNGDLIERQAAIDAFERFIHELGIKDEPYNYGEMALSAQNVPSVENKGEWIDEGFYAEGHSEHAYRCSECGEHYIGYVGEFKFCPNCGAKMKGGE